MNKKIIDFLNKKHLLTLCVCHEQIIHSCSCFYAFDECNYEVIFASSDETKHIQLAKLNPHVAVNIAHETKIIGLIKGIQANGIFKKCEHEDIYFKKFPYALALKPKLHSIELTWIKYTDNALSNKIIWSKNN